MKAYNFKIPSVYLKFWLMHRKTYLNAGLYEMYNGRKKKEAEEAKEK
jgi:hypothetical protein